MEMFYSYILINILFAVGTILGIGASRITSKPIMGLSALQAVRLNYVLIGICLIAATAVFLVPEETFVRPIPQVFSGAATTIQSVLLVPTASFGTEATIAQVSLPMSQLIFVLLGIVLGLVLRIVFQLRRTLQGLKRSHNYKSIGGVRIVLSEIQTTPFAFSFLGRSYISMPLQLLGESAAFRIALKHEFQHIRHRDTLSVYFLELWKVFCFWNPFVHIWIQKISMDQEFSCDESLLVHQKIHHREYVDCLLEVANLGNEPKVIPFGATGIIFGNSHPQILKRIEAMKKIKKRKVNIFGGAALAMVPLIFYGHFGNGIEELCCDWKIDFRKGF